MSLYDIQIYRVNTRLFTYHLTNDYVTPSRLMSSHLAGDTLLGGGNIILHILVIMNIITYFGNVDYRNVGCDN